MSSYLSRSASSSFSGRKSDIFTALKVAVTLQDVSNACYHYVTSRGKLGDVKREDVCKALLDWHIGKVSDKSLSSIAVVKNLNRCLEYVGCSPLDESCEGPHKVEQQILCNLVFSRAVENIVTADGGDLVNMYLKEYMRTTAALSISPGSESRRALGNLVERKDSDWKISNLKVLGLSPAEMSPA